MTQRAVVSSAILILVGTAGVLFAYGQMLSRPAERASPVPFNTIYNGNGAHGYSRPADIVIENQSTWSSVWNSAFCSEGQCPPLPEINFTARTVIAAFYGMGGFSTNSIRIDDVTRIDSTLNVHVLRGMGGNCGSLIVTFYPAHIVDIPKLNLQVSFSTETVPSNC